MTSSRLARQGFRVPPYLVAIGLFLIAKLVLAALLLAGDPNVYLYGDGREYMSIADAWARSGIYSRLADGSRPEVFRLPGYPLFLLLFQGIEAGQRAAVVSFVQLVLFHVWLFFVARWIARRFGNASATAFVVLLSLPVIWVHYPATVHSDFQFAVLVFTGIVLMMEAMAPGARRGALLGGAVLCLGGAALTRPDLILFPLWLLVSAALAPWLNRFAATPAERIAARPQLVVAAGVAAPMALWGVRNYLATGRFTYTSVVDFAATAFAAGGAPAAAASGGQAGAGGTALLDMVLGIVEHLQTLAAGFGPALAKVLFGPGRWYFHRYLYALDIDIDSRGVPFSAIGFGGLHWAGKLYLVASISVSVFIVLAFLAFLYLYLRGRIPVYRSWVLLGVWVLAYFAVQKGIWGAFTAGSGPRYAMSMVPLFAFFASLVLARPAPRDGAPFPAAAVPAAPRLGAGR